MFTFGGAGQAARADTAALVEISPWQDAKDRRWLGEDFWANRLQDWAVIDGTLVCRSSWGGWGVRTAHLLTRDLRTDGAFQVELELDRGAAGQAGILLGGGEGQLNYQQASLIQGSPGTGGGFLVAWNFQNATLTIHNFGKQVGKTELRPVPGHEVVQPLGDADPSTATLVVDGTPDESGGVVLRARLMDGEQTLAESVATVEADRLVGNIALASDGSTEAAPHRFHAFRVGGDRVAEHLDRAYGPIAGVLFSVGKGDLKVGVQLMSVGATITETKGEEKGRRLAVRLEENIDGAWQPIAPPAGISEPDYYALIRLSDYDASRPRSFRIVCNGDGDLAASYTFDVPAEPEGDMVVGSVSCTGVLGRRSNQPDITDDGTHFAGRWSPANIWFPYTGITDPMLDRELDIIFFTGDQLYEYNPTSRDKSDAFPVEDYLYKWLLWHWSFNDVTRRIPSIMQTDDHDVWHPNLWGDGGRLMTEGWDSGGGFLMSSYFVNMVQRTMCGHNPDPYDPGPLDSGVTNYFTTFTYGGVDFAVLEDRKFKAAYNAETRQADDGSVLGDLQLEMLRKWAEDPDASDARVVVSQTVYAKVSTYVENNTIGKDMDANAWPKPGRDRAVELFEQAGALLFTGDQHLATVSRLESDGNGVIQFAQPAGGCIWWRQFQPDPALRLAPVDPRIAGPDRTDLGLFEDGFGNRFSVMAVANPGDRAHVAAHPNPQTHRLTQRDIDLGRGTAERIHGGEGFAALHIRPSENRITLECWPLGADVSQGAAAQFPDWPIVLTLDEFDVVEAGAE
ncbi:MAG: alkaline phosphatase D family protein [Planctomycetota bacterium]